MKFTFIDLFAGIGGFRQAFESVGGKCVFSSESDKFAKQTYQANYGEIPYGDIRKFPKKLIPNHDILCAGFPCQPFSIARISKKKLGFEDGTRGTLFFEIKEILRLKRPIAFILENVKNLLFHNKGETFEIIKYTLENLLGYVINWEIINSSKWVPQHRERIFIVGFDPNQINISQKHIIIPKKPSKKYIYPKLSGIIKKNVKGYTLGKGTWEALKRHKIYHTTKGNGFGYTLITFPIPDNAVTRTISARYYKDGAEILIEQKGRRPRRLSIQEAMQLQGYDPEKFIFPVSKTQAYKQIGNSITIPVVKTIAIEIVKILQNRRRNENN